MVAYPLPFCKLQPKKFLVPPGGPAPSPRPPPFPFEQPPSLQVQDLSALSQVGLRQARSLFKMKTVDFPLGLFYSYINDPWSGGLPGRSGAPGR